MFKQVYVVKCPSTLLRLSYYQPFFITPTQPQFKKPSRKSFNFSCANLIPVFIIRLPVVQSNHLSINHHATPTVGHPHLSVIQLVRLFLRVCVVHTVYVVCVRVLMFAHACFSTSANQSPIKLSQSNVNLREQIRWTFFSSYNISAS